MTAAAFRRELWSYILPSDIMEKGEDVHTSACRAAQIWKQDAHGRKL